MSKWRPWFNEDRVLLMIAALVCFGTAVFIACGGAGAQRAGTNPVQRVAGALPDDDHKLACGRDAYSGQPVEYSCDVTALRF